MSYSDDSLKKAAETKEWLERKINELEIELNSLQDTLAVVNSVLKSSSFQPAHTITKSNSMVNQGSLSSNSYRKSCNVCQVEIEMRKIDDRWGAYILDSDERHKCDNDE
tara:strand:- start:5723 stop:6049 length:327 start_codon:yes stop_codon:yes gene_type:complete